MQELNSLGGLGTMKAYQRAQRSQAHTAGQIATGLRINTAADDAAGLAISELMRAEIKGGEMAGQNIENADGMLNTANGYLQNANDIVGRMKELAVAKGNGILTTEQKDALGAEFDALKTELQRTFSEAKYNGQDLFTSNPVAVAVDASGTSVAMNGLDAAGTNAAVAGLSIDSVGSVDAAVGAVTSQRSSLGASQSDLQYLLTALENSNENVSQAESRIRNLDLAKASTRLASDTIRSNLSTAMLANGKVNAQNVLRLLT